MSPYMNTAVREWQKMIYYIHLCVCVCVCVCEREWVDTQYIMCGLDETYQSV